MKIAKRRCYKNVVHGIVLAAIQITEDPIKRRTDGTSAFNTRIARGRLLLLDPARGEEKFRESSGSTTAWWWSLWYSCRASPSSTEEKEELEYKLGKLHPGCYSLLLLDPARGEEKLRESFNSTSAWWWSLRFSGRASPSATEEDEV